MEFIQQDIYANDTGIYQIRNTENGYVYIGQTRERFNRRFWHHRWKLQDGSHDNPQLQNDYNTYGKDAFVFEILETLEDRAALDASEIRYISAADKKYNMLGGGGGRLGYAMKDSTKQLIGEANRQHLLGHKQSEATRKKRSESLKGNPKMRQKKFMTATEDGVILAKRSLMQGNTIEVAAQESGLSYKQVNGILSGNAWNNYYVEGWDEFIRTRPVKRRMTREDAEAIRAAYQEGSTIESLMHEYDVCRDTIKNVLNRKTFK